MEVRLLEEFKKRRALGLAVHRRWFIRRAKRILREEFPEEILELDSRIIYSCRFSASWFRAFKHRGRISWRAKTNTASITPIDKIPHIQSFLQFIRRNAQCRQLPMSPQIEPEYDVGRFRLCHIFNMDQTPLPFEFLHGRTYEFKGKKTVWIRALKSSWSKRQATLMITACADGSNRIKPLIIFRGDDDWYGYEEERAQYDPRVHVLFNKKAYSNESVTLQWLTEDVFPVCRSNTSTHEPCLMVLDVFAGQKTATILRTFKRNNFVSAYVPEGCTGLVQPMDTAINSLLKDKISEVIEDEMDENPDQWDDNNYHISDRRILIVKAVAEAWSWLHQHRKEVIIKSFQQVGISLKPDGSQDHLLHIRDLPNLVVGSWVLERPENAPTGTSYGLDCNLSSDGHTGVGTLEFELQDDDLIDEDFFDEYAPQENQGDGDYVLDSELEVPGSACMSLDFLCR